jgi:hypothetical protein
MQLKHSLIVSYLTALTASSPVVDSRSRWPDGMLMADSHDTINLDSYEHNASNVTGLEKRIPWDICFRSEGKFGQSSLHKADRVWLPS